MFILMQFPCYLTERLAKFEFFYYITRMYVYARIPRVSPLYPHALTLFLVSFYSSGFQQVRVGVRVGVRVEVTLTLRIALILMKCKCSVNVMQVFCNRRKDTYLAVILFTLQYAVTVPGRDIYGSRTRYMRCSDGIYLVFGPHISRVRTAYIPCSNSIYAVQTPLPRYLA